jgi:hypothetical protein
MTDNPVSGPGTPTLPKCRDCGARTARVVTIPSRVVSEVRHEWLCASCEYLREHPDAPRFVKPPRERAKRLQKETLLDLLSERAV